MNLKEICLDVVTISKEIGTWMKEERCQFSTNKIESKTFNNLVSYVDKESERRFVLALKKLIPNSDILGEEGIENVDLKSEYLWIIDPLDGTTNYIHGVPKYCTSVALQRNGETILGVIYEPNNDECFYAYSGGGAFLNGNLINITSTTDTKNSLLATGFPYDYFDALDQYLELLKFLMKNSRGIRRIGAAALDLCYVACGRFDAFFEMALQPWDVAAGAFIVSEAGGSTSDFNGGEDYVYGKTVLSTNGHIHAELLQHIKNFLK